MNRNCRVSGCCSPAASNFAAYCHHHRANARRHGAVDQRAVSLASVRPYLLLVSARIRKNPHNTAWTTLDARWRALVDAATGIVASHEAGRPGSRFEVSAAYEVVKLGREVEPRSVVEMTAAVVMMRELSPSLFKSDDAFWMQLCRRVRALADLNFGERYVHATGKVKRCYRDLTPRSALIMGRWLAETLGIAGVHMARLERASAGREASASQRLHNDLAELG